MSRKLRDKARTKAKQPTKIDPVSSIEIEQREGFGFGGELLVIVVTVVLAEFGKAFAGEFAKAIVQSIAKSVATIRKRSPVEVIYKGSPFKKYGAELVIRYGSAKELKKDEEQHPLYVAIAAGYVAARPPRAGETVSLADILKTDSPNKPESILLRINTQ